MGDKTKTRKKKPPRVLFVIFFGALFLASAVFGAAQEVYTTPYGGSYHRENCSTTSSSVTRKITVQEAALAGYKPCRVCKPLVVDAPAEKNAEAAGFYRVNIEGISSYKAAEISKMQKAVVTRHVDGDTVEVRFISKPAGIINQTEKIRMIGVDTPETVHPKKGVEAFGKEASEYTKRALLNKNVYIALDWDIKDKYGRLLAYIYTEDGKVCHNAKLIQEGYAHAYTIFPFQFLEEFKALEKEARSRKRGLWGDLHENR